MLVGLTILPFMTINIHLQWPFITINIQQLPGRLYQIHLVGYIIDKLHFSAVMDIHEVVN